MRTSNVGYFGAPDPIMQASGLAGLGQSVSDEMFGTYGTDYSTPPFVPSPNTSPWYTDPKVITAINKEAVFGINLFRGMNNQAPLTAAQSAPDVTVGISPDTQRMLLLGGAGVLAFMMLKGGKRRKRR